MGTTLDLGVNLSASTSSLGTKKGVEKESFCVVPGSGNGASPSYVILHYVGSWNWCRSHYKVPTNEFVWNTTEMQHICQAQGFLILVGDR